MIKRLSLSIILLFVVAVPVAISAFNNEPVEIKNLSLEEMTEKCKPLLKQAIEEEQKTEILQKLGEWLQINTLVCTPISIERELFLKRENNDKASFGRLTTIFETWCDGLDEKKELDEKLKKILSNEQTGIYKKRKKLSIEVFVDKWHGESEGITTDNPVNLQKLAAECGFNLILGTWNCFNVECAFLKKGYRSELQHLVKMIDTVKNSALGFSVALTHYDLGLHENVKINGGSAYPVKLLKDLFYYTTVVPAFLGGLMVGPSLMFGAVRRYLLAAGLVSVGFEALLRNHVKSGFTYADGKTKSKILTDVTMHQPAAFALGACVSVGISAGIKSLLYLKKIRG